MSLEKVLVKSLIIVFFLLGVLLLVNTTYKNRHRYQAVSMCEFYDWAAELRAGGDPWNLDDSYRPPAGVIHRGHCNYPPAFLRAFELLTLMRPIVAYWVWQTLLVVSLLTATVLMVRELSPPAGMAPYAIALGAVLLFPEVYGSLYESAPTLLLLLMLVAAWICDRRGQSAAAGLMMAVAALFKLYPGLVGGYFLVRGRWATLVWAIAFGLAGLLLSKTGDQVRFANAGLFHSVWLTDDHWLRDGRSIATLSNIRAMLDWIYGTALPQNAVPLWLALTAAADVVLICPVLYLTARTKNQSQLDAPCFGLWLCVTMMVSPIAWGHYLPLVIPLLLSVAALMLRQPRFSTAGGLILALGLIASVLTYFCSPLLHMHTFFLATAAIYAGACLLVLSWSRSQTAAIH